MLYVAKMLYIFICIAAFSFWYFWNLIKKQYGEQLLDLYGVIIEYKQAFIKYVDLGCTVFNLLDRSQSPISNGSLKFIVDHAPSFREHQFVAWFYRNHQIPDELDWITALQEFKLDKIPDHTLLRLIQSIPTLYMDSPTNSSANPTISSATSSTTFPHRISVMIDHISHQRGITNENGKCIVGEIIAGSLAPRQLFRDAR